MDVRNFIQHVLGRCQWAWTPDAQWPLYSARRFHAQPIGPASPALGELLFLVHPGQECFLEALTIVVQAFGQKRGQQIVQS